MTVKISPVNIENRQKIGIRAGDTVRVWQKIQEKGKIRLQAFEGLVLARKHKNEPGATFTVRKVSNGVGVEKIFPLYSPMIDKIEIVRRSKVRRAKLYFIREKVAREIRKQMRNMKMMNIATVSDMEEKTKTEEDAKATEEKVNAEEVVEEKTEDTKEEQKAETEAKATESSSPDASKKASKEEPALADDSKKK